MVSWLVGEGDGLKEKALILAARVFPVEVVFRKLKGTEIES